MMVASFSFSFNNHFHQFLFPYTEYGNEISIKMLLHPISYLINLQSRNKNDIYIFLMEDT